MSDYPKYDCKFHYSYCGESRCMYKQKKHLTHDYPPCNAETCKTYLQDKANHIRKNFKIVSNGDCDPDNG